MVNKKMIITTSMAVLAAGGLTLLAATKTYADNNNTVDQIEELSYQKTETSCEKPVIYLYGYDNEDVTVELDFNGEFTCTYPKADKGKWKVTAQKDGSLTVGNKKYSYLYWEGNTTAKFDFSGGACVSGDKTAEYLENAISKLGLTAREANDFMTYWLPKMKDNPYNVISFQGGMYRDIAKMSVTPEPDKIIRVFMAYYPSDKKVDIEKQELTGNAIRNSDSKYVVEWGGAQVDPETLQAVSIGKTNSDNDALVQQLSKLNDDELKQVMSKVYEEKNPNDAVQAGPTLSGLPPVLTAGGHDFTDKNGQTTTFTNDEWNFLINTWAYTGMPEAIIQSFTIGELRAWINNNYKK